MKKSNILSYILIGFGSFLIVLFWIVNGVVNVENVGVVIGMYLIGYFMLGYGLNNITNIDDLDKGGIERKKKLCKYLLGIALLIVILLLVYYFVIYLNILDIIFIFFVSWHIWLIVILFISISLVRLNEIKRLSLK